MSKMRILSFAAALVATLAWGSLGGAQDTPKPKDDALDKLLEKLDETRSPDTAKPAPEKKDQNEPEGAGTTTPKTDKPTAAPAEKARGEVDSKDQALDKVLEKLGETKDVPSPDDRPKTGGGKPDDEPMPPKSRPDPSKTEEPKGKDKEIDKRLEELTGRRPKKKDQDEDGEGSGPLGDVIKKMREVEQRLDKTDTGEQTRQKQTEIVKNLEKIIDQLRSTSSKSKGKKKMQLAVKPGQQPGSQPGSQQGTNPGQAPNQKPLKPTDRRSLVNGKDEWGHLPPELRQELDNVMKEAPLSKKEDLIRRYYLSVNKKSLSREE